MPFLESKWFAVLYGLVVALNPLALLPQLISVIITGKVEGLSLLMFLVFVSIQSAVALGAIKELNWKLFLSMFISALETSTIVAFVVVIRYF
ncbi:MAG: hypothetical protein MRY49_01330, partial [Candidatus Pacebacteria bacterium]|nr:hypothetical protein [Candidatus Paceibacterota bacterium]